MTEHHTVAGALRSYGVALDEGHIVRALAATFAATLTPPFAAGLSLAEHEALLAGGVNVEAYPGAYEAAVEVSIGAYAALLANSIALTAAATRMHVSRARVQQMVSRGELWAIQFDRKWLLPLVQFGADGRPVRGLSVVLTRMNANTRHPLAVLGFLTTAQPEFPVDDVPLSALDWLARGGAVDAVEGLAGSFDVLG